MEGLVDNDAFWAEMQEGLSDEENVLVKNLTRRFDRFAIGSTNQTPAQNPDLILWVFHKVPQEASRGWEKREMRVNLKAFSTSSEGILLPRRC